MAWYVASVPVWALGVFLFFGIWGFIKKETSSRDDVVGVIVLLASIAICFAIAAKMVS